MAAEYNNFTQGRNRFLHTSVLEAGAPPPAPLVTPEHAQAINAAAHRQALENYALASQYHPAHPPGQQYNARAPWNYAQGPHTGHAQAQHPQYHAEVPQNYNQPMQNYAQRPQNFQQPRDHAPMQRDSHARGKRVQQYGRAAPTSQQTLEAFIQAHPNHGSAVHREQSPVRHAVSGWTDFATQPIANATQTPATASMRTQTRPDPRSQEFVPQQPISLPERVSHMERNRRGGDVQDDEGEYAINTSNNLHIKPIVKPALTRKAHSNSESESGSTRSQTSHAATRMTLTVSTTGPVRQTAYTLAQAIKRGETEKAADKAWLQRRYTPRMRLVEPVVGPALRIKNSDMFSRVDDVQPPKSTKLIRSGLGLSEDIPAPDWLSTVQQGLCAPTLDELMDDLPITELYRTTDASTAGVIKIQALPFETTRSEVCALLGGNAQVLHLPETSTYPAIHIIMERETGRTLDCYVELSSLTEAHSVLRTLKRRGQAGRPSMIGNRIVQTVLSSQAELMADLFPRAKHVSWRGGHPLVDRSSRSYYPGHSAVGFRGFIHSEELVVLLKHAASKERPPFVTKSITRPFETLISIMYKYPWYAPKYFSIAERDEIYNATIRLMGSIIDEIENGDSLPGPTTLSLPLLQEMVIAALVCPGFSERQKEQVIFNLQSDGYGYMAQNVPTSIRPGGSHPFAYSWPFTALCAVPGSDNATLQYYLQALHQADFHLTGNTGPIPFDYHGSDDPTDLSLSTAGRIEFTKIEELLEAFVRQISNPEPPDRQDSPLFDSHSDAPSDNPTVVTAADKAAAEKAAADKAATDAAIVGMQRRRAYTLAQSGAQRREANALAQAHPEDFSGEFPPAGVLQQARDYIMAQPSPDIENDLFQHKPSDTQARRLNVVRGTVAQSPTGAESDQSQFTPSATRGRRRNVVRGTPTQPPTDAENDQSQHDHLAVRRRRYNVVRDTAAQALEAAQARHRTWAQAQIGGEAYGRDHLPAQALEGHRTGYGHSSYAPRPMNLPLPASTVSNIDPPAPSNRSDPSGKHIHDSTSVRSNFAW